jgi:hypothetical protein
MVAPTGAPSQNSSSRYPTIGRSEASDAWTSNDRLVQNLSPNFNAVLLQTIMELIQHMAPEGSLLIALAQQQVEVANHVIDQNAQSKTIGENPLVVTDQMVGQSVPEVRHHL